MHVAVASGAWPLGSILSVRVDGVRRQAPLEAETALQFPKLPAGEEPVQVDVYARVGSTRLVYRDAQHMYSLDIENDGFSSLALRMRPYEQREAGDDAITDEPAPDLVRPDSPGDDAEVTAEERNRRIRLTATQYIERHDLRQLLQDLFQSTVKARPDEPLDFMRAALAGSKGAASASEESSQRYKEVIATQKREMEELLQQNRLLEEKLKTVPDDGQTAALQTQVGEAQLEVARLAQELELSQQKVWEAEQSRDLSAAALGERMRSTHDAELQALQTQLGEAQRQSDASQVVIERQREEIMTMQNDMETARLADEQQRSQSAQAQEAVVAELRRQLAAQEARLRTQHEEEAELLRSQVEGLKCQLQRDAQGGGSCTPADAAAGSSRERTKEAGHDGLKQAHQKGYAALAPPVAAGGPTPQQQTASTGLHLASTAGVTSLASSGDSAHFLSQIMASTYAPPILPAMFCEPREDDEDTDGPVVSTELMVSVSDCKEPSANGPYARVGECNARPLYRMLGSQPRYLYFVAVDKAWQGWWIADRMGSQDYIEWFSNPSEAKLPTYCAPGVLGSRVTEATLTRGIAEKIAMIGSQQEKTCIRERLTEAYGPQFAKLDGGQRGLMAKSSPVVAVAHALEAQQRAIQLLHAQLATTTQHREAAEVHAKTMEDAFEELQLRIRANLPGGPANARVK